MIRLYFNEHGERPWSVDKGTADTEETYSEVIFESSIGKAMYKPGEVPCAWIEFNEQWHVFDSVTYNGSRLGMIARRLYAGGDKA